MRRCHDGIAVVPILSRLIYIVSTNSEPLTTRQRLLDATVELLRTKGPAASGTQEILTRAAAPRGSFYFHFPDGKDQLVVEAVERAAAATADGMDAAFDDRSLALPDRVIALFTSVATALAADDYRLGCAVGATVVEAAATTPAFRDVTAAAFASWNAVIVRHFITEGITSDHAIMLADNVIASLEGATMMARARHDTTPLEQMGDMLGGVVAAVLDEVRGKGPS